MIKVFPWPNGGQTTLEDLSELGGKDPLIQITDHGTPYGDKSALHSVTYSETLAIAHIQFGLDLLEVVREARQNKA
jgi:hypothetical protein